jgi:hypothetical protein
MAVCYPTRFCVCISSWRRSTSVFYRTNAHFHEDPSTAAFHCHIQSAHTRQSSAQSSPSLPCCPFGSHDFILAGFILDAKPIYLNHPDVQIAQCRWQSYAGRISLVSNDLDEDAWVGCNIRFPPAAFVVKQFITWRVLTTRQHHDMSDKRLCTWRKGSQPSWHLAEVSGCRV